MYLKPDYCVVIDFHIGGDGVVSGGLDVVTNIRASLIKKDDWSQNQCKVVNRKLVDLGHHHQHKTSH